MNDVPEPNTRDNREAPPANWREAAADLVSARIALIELEARDAARNAGRKGVLGGILAGAAFFTWALILAGLIPLLASACEVSWGWIALGLAALHAIVAGVCFALIRKPVPPAFSLTRSEFQRDSEWFKNL
ncbi:MAG: phage holin family protein [Luteolibacter sp.]